MHHTGKRSRSSEPVGRRDIGGDCKWRTGRPSSGTADDDSQQPKRRHEFAEQLRVATLVVARSLSVRETEKILASSVIVRKRNVKELRRTPLTDVEERLQKRLGTKVSVLNGRHGGKVIIHYFSPAELDGLLEQLLQ